MLRCPITYNTLTVDEVKYSKKGLALLSRTLTYLHDLSYTQAEQLEKAKSLAIKMAIQGVQPKLSAIFNTRQQGFEFTERGGTFIIKPQNNQWAHLPENEDLTMRLAQAIGIEVPLHGLIYCKDESLSYWIRRFDRPSLKSPLTHKLPVEDFAQLSGESRHTKYRSTMEKVIKIIEQFCTFPALEREKLFKLTLFNFLTGNEDMHLKNFSLIIRQNIVSLSPAYDLLNTTLAMGTNTIEELALPLNGKKNHLKRADFIDYFAQEKLQLLPPIIKAILGEIEANLDHWHQMIEFSFLPPPYKVGYKNLLTNRSHIIFD
ncbi:MAG: HipA domain-containing protein [Candidatus Paracaedibacteraceae bacterium]|nr:HipA domain-containing protein [Candidatus Paracaedibacteraceae bacterium]